MLRSDTIWQSFVFVRVVIVRHHFLFAKERAVVGNRF